MHAISCKCVSIVSFNSDMQKLDKQLIISIVSSIVSFQPKRALIIPLFQILNNIPRGRQPSPLDFKLISNLPQKLKIPSPSNRNEFDKPTTGGKKFNQSEHGKKSTLKNSICEKSMRDQKRVTLYIAGSTRGDGTCSFSPLLQEPLYFLLLRPTANPLARPNSSTHPLSRVSLSVSRGAVPLLVLFPPSNTDIPAAMYPFSTVYYANIILKRSGRGTVQRIPPYDDGQWSRLV